MFCPHKSPYFWLVTQDHKLQVRTVCSRCFKCHLGKPFPFYVACKTVIKVTKKNCLVYVVMAWGLSFPSLCSVFLIPTLYSLTLTTNLYAYFSKAFDLVCHNILLTKLYKYGVHGDLLNWCRDYLTERQQRVVVKGEASDWLTVTSGVPQGSLLGPLFFIVYINNLPGVISKDSSIALYADDSKMYRVISTQEDLSTFQSDIDKISAWCKMNKMRINTKKCKIMRITRKKSPLVGEYTIEGQPLESVDVYKDLGLFTTSSLSWNQHVDKITAKANRVLGLVNRTCRDLKDIDTMNTLYCSLVRPLLEYSCETWNPHTKRNIDKLEAVQQRATRWITRSDDDYDMRLSKLKLLSLSNRRFTRDVTFFFNVINGHYDIDISNKLTFCKDRNTGYNLRKNDTQDLVPNFSRTDGFKYSFFNRVVDEWNGLPNHIRE